jgi:hypothetical protein
MTTDQEGQKEADKEEVAKRYVDEQLALLGEYGNPVRISRSSYASIVKQVARVSK